MVSIRLNDDMSRRHNLSGQQNPGYIWSSERYYCMLLFHACVQKKKIFEPEIVISFFLSFLVFSTLICLHIAFTSPSFVCSLFLFKD